MSTLTTLLLPMFAWFGISLNHGVLYEQPTTDNSHMHHTNAEERELHTASHSTAKETKQRAATTTMLVAGGCFWCVEADLEKLPGVTEVTSGYAGGRTEQPTYENYAAGGHQEVVRVTYDPTVVSFEEILIVALKTMDPTDGAGSFADRGQEYAPAFYYETEEQRQRIEQLLAEVDQRGPYEEPLAVAVEQRPTFWPAEDYHQDYYNGTLSGVKYQYYRRASGRDAFIAEHWGENTGPTLPWRENDPMSDSNHTTSQNQPVWQNYEKPNRAQLREQLDPLVYTVTQEDGTEPAGSSPLDKQWEPGIYVDVLSGEPVFSSADKFDSGTGWPSFTKPITPDAVTEHADWSLLGKRTEIRSAIADNHLGHVFTDGPRDSTGLRYCMNGVALEFIPRAEMAQRGYEAYLAQVPE